MTQEQKAINTLGTMIGELFDCKNFNDLHNKHAEFNGYLKALSDLSIISRKDIISISVTEDSAYASATDILYSYLEKNEA